MEKLGSFSPQAEKIPSVQEDKPASPVLIYDDPRPIESIWLFGEGAGGWKVGGANYGCDRIVAYREHGQADWVAFYAIYEDDEIVARVSAAQVIVYYAKSTGASRALGEQA